MQQQAAMSEEIDPYFESSSSPTFAEEEPTDLDLIRQCQSPDRPVADEAFEELVARYGPRLYRMAYRTLGDRVEAWDICQETFVRAFISMKKFDERLSFYTWLYRIGMNLTIDTLRRRKVRKTSSLGEPGLYRSNQRPPDEILERSELAEMVQEVLGRLPEKYRVMLVLRDLEGFTPREITKIVKLPSSLVRWRIHHARKLFKELWSGRQES